MELFKLVGSIFIKSKDANEQIEDVRKKAKKLATDVGNSMKSVGDKMSSVGTKMLPVSIAIGGFATMAVKSSAEIKAMSSQFEQTFGDLQEQARSSIGSVASEAGILETRLQGVGTSIYAFAKSSGADSAEAMELMETALRATADASAYYDRSLEDTSESLMSFLKGNFANDAQLGVSCTETTRNAKAMELFGKKYNDLSEVQKQQTLLKMVTDAQKLSGAMGQASRESDGFENVTGNLTESVKIFSAELGAVLLPKVISLLQKATAFIQKFSQMDAGTKKLIVVLGLLVGSIAPVLIIIGKVLSSVGTIILWMPKIKAGIILIKTGLTALWTVMKANPIGVIITIIGLLVGAFIYLWNNSEAFRNFWINLWNKIKEVTSKVVTAISDFFKKSWDKIKSTVTNALNSVKSTVTNILNNVKSTVTNALDNVKSKFTTIWGNVKSTVTNALDNVKSNISNKLNSAKSTVTNVLNGIKTKFSTIFDNVKKTVSGAIDKIKGMFNFSWSLPKIKLPHFKVSGGKAPWGFMGKGSLPSVSVEWYKKGGIMTDPTLFGYNPVTGKAMVGGEAGAEAIAPIDLLQEYVATAVSNQNTILAETLESLFGKLFGILEKYFPEFTKQVVLDTGVLVGELAPKMDTALGKIANHKGRGN